MSNEDDPRWDKAFNAWNSGDREGAIFVFKSLASSGVTAAFSRLGEAYESKGTTQNFSEAIRWYKKSYYENNDLTGAIGLARMYYYGRGTKEDNESAFRIYNDIKQSHDPIVYLMLGRFYQFGYVVEKDLKKAKYNYLKSIALKNIPAIRNLAYIEKEQGRYCVFINLILKAVISYFKVASKNPKDDRLSIQ